MIPLEQLLDGLDVEVDPWDRDSTPTTRGRPGVLALTGGAVIRFSNDRVTVSPARRRPRPLENDTPRDGPAVRKTSRNAATSPVRIRATFRGAVGVFDHMQDTLVETFAANDPLRRSLDELCGEMVARKPGARAMVETLARRCLILLLRRCFEHTEHRRSWLALEDARLSRAVAAMQAEPGQVFRLSTLAQVAGMSRSVFAARFATVLGEPPMEFLRIVRLGRAAHLLSRTDLPVKSIASQVGYSSRSSFTRAFVARYGAAPARFRTTAVEPPSHLRPTRRTAA